MKKLVVVILGCFLLTVMLFVAGCNGETQPSQGENGTGTGNEGSTPSGGTSQGSSSPNYNISGTSVVLGAFTCTPNADGSSYCVVKYTGNEEKVVIPSTCKDMPVTGIDRNAFYNCNSITDITIPDSVTSISYRAFYNTGYYNDEANWENGVLYIGSFLIEAKISVSGAYDIKDGTSCIADSAFCKCRDLTRITLPESLTSIGDSAFSDCAGLTEIRFNAKQMNDLASTNRVFRNIGKNSGGVKVTIGKQVARIPAYLFGGSTSVKVTSVELEAGSACEEVGAYAFSDTDYYKDDANWENEVLYIGNCLIEAESSVNGAYSIKMGTVCIADRAFSSCSNITSINIPDGVKCIGSYAFSDCTGLTSITLPDSVKRVGYWAFGGCGGIMRVNINDITAWCAIDFDDGYSNPLYYAIELYIDDSPVTELVIPDGITSIGSYTFFGCRKLTSITVPESVTEIGCGAFKGCSSLKSITLPFVGSSAFANEASSSTLFGYIFGSSSYTGGTSTEQYYTSNSYSTYYIPLSLRTVTITGGDIQYGAFWGCDYLTSINIGNSVTSIGGSAFYNCSSLTSVTIGDGVTSIGSSAFNGCSSLESITLPFVGSSVSAIAASSSTLFGYIFGASSYTDGTSTKQYYSSDKYSTYYIPTSLRSVTITGGNILYGAFYGCGRLTSVTIGNSVTSIGSCAFYGCSALTSITIPESVTSIGKYAFYNCTELTEIKFNAVAMIDLSYSNYVFSNAGKNGDGIKVTIGKEVTKIPAYLFCPYSSTSYSPKITSVEFEEGSVCESIGSDAFYNTEYYNNEANWENGVLYIGKYLIKAKTSISGSYTIKDGTLCIADYAFYNCSSLTSVTIGDSVTSIGNGAFYNCSSLTSVTIGDSVTSIGSEAFYNTGYYNDEANWENEVLYIGKYLIDGKNSISGSYTIKDGTLCIADGAFCYCDSLTSVTIPNSVTSIGSSTFSGCDSLTSITIGDSVTSIGAGAFYNCYSLTSITIPDSVTSIGKWAFHQCNSLTSITIPNSVTSIEDYAFYYCRNLTTINYTGSEEEWNAISKGYDWDRSTRSYTIVYNYVGE